MAKFKITVAGPSGKDRPSFSTVVEADNAKLAQRYVQRAVQLGAKYLIEEVEERRPTLRAAL
jgi:hypothetical protein